MLIRVFAGCACPESCLCVMSDHLKIESVEGPFDSDQNHSANAHVIVCGNEKGGSGKTTTSMHVAVALMKKGFRVATVDLDSRQSSLTRYVENRKRWSEMNGLSLEQSSHFRFDGSKLDSAMEAQMQDFSAFLCAISEIESDHDFIVVDTPGSDGYLMRLAHSMADTLLTPMNDSFVDFDILGKVDALEMEVVDISHYAKMVRNARRKRRDADDGLLDWIVVRNRLASLSSNNERNVHKCLHELSMRLGFRVADGISERVIFRQYFPKGLTALDDFELLSSDQKPNVSHAFACEEIEKLISALRLPINDNAREMAQARQIWMKKSYTAVDMPDIFAD